jgi:CheY-like chemotaxis protein
LDVLQKISDAKERSTRIDLAIIDLIMPNMDGFALIERLGTMSETQNIPIIVLSASVLTSKERTELRPHVEKFFSKGTVDLETLKAEITRFVKRPTSKLPARTNTPFAT